MTPETDLVEENRQLRLRLEALEALARQVAAPGAITCISRDTETGELLPYCTFCGHRPVEHAADCPVTHARALVGDQVAGQVVRQLQEEEPTP